jgi:hypothetical protein
MELDDLIEVAAHIEALRLLVLPMVAREEQRDLARLKKRRQRTNLTVTHDSDAPALARESV